MPYTKQWAALQPGCLIFLIDQSGSMDELFGGNQIGAGKKKSDMVATLLNKILDEFISANRQGPEVRPRGEVAVIGYGDTRVEEVIPPFRNLKALAEAPLRIDKRKKKEIDDTGALVEIDVDFPVWVEPKAAGNTPMWTALKRARTIAEDWIRAHPDNYPPVIVNVTDGMATDVPDPEKPVELIEESRRLTDLATSDGNCLLFTCHITHLTDPETKYPGSESEIPNDVFAKTLFQMSSVIPEEARNQIKGQAGVDLPVGARAFIFNGDANSVRQMFIFASIPGRVNPNA